MKLGARTRTRTRTRTHTRILSCPVLFHLTASPHLAPPHPTPPRLDPSHLASPRLFVIAVTPQAMKLGATYQLLLTLPTIYCFLDQAMKLGTTLFYYLLLTNLTTY